jgi:hypothetical protein
MILQMLSKSSKFEVADFHFSAGRKFWLLSAGTNLAIRLSTFSRPVRVNYRSMLLDWLAVSSCPLSRACRFRDFLCPRGYDVHSTACVEKIELACITHLNQPSTSVGAMQILFQASKALIARARGYDVHSTASVHGCA